MGERSGRWALGLPAAGLFVAALVLRWPAISTDGLLFDDAWVAIGATKASAGQLLSVSTMHPGFTAVLMGWSALTPADTTWTTLPVYLVGAATPAIVFLLLCRLGIRWWVSLVVGILVVVAPTHIVYSGRVKPYMLETLVILLVAAGLGRISGRRWSPWTAVAWVAGAMLVATVNAFAFAAIAIAAVILLLHPRGDVAVRAVAVAVQAALQVLYLGTLQQSFDAEALEAGWGDVFDGYVELDADPADMAHELGTHLGRVGQVVVENRWLALGLVVVGFGGLAVRAWRGPRQVMARFLLALPAVAFVGSVAERLPFGTMIETLVYPGTRASLWLLPSVLVGLAFALDAGDRALERRGRAPRVVGMAAVGVILATIVISGVRYDAGYPAPGAETAHGLVAEGATGNDLVVVLENGRWPYSAVPEVGVTIDALPDTMVGFEPSFADDGVYLLAIAAPWEGSPAQQHLATSEPARVVIVNGYVGLLDGQTTAIEAELGERGYELTGQAHAGTTDARLWERSEA